MSCQRTAAGRAACSSGAQGLPPRTAARRPRAAPLASKPVKHRRRNERLKGVAPAAVSSVGQSSSSSKYLYAGESSFNLSEYMVVLDKPIGLTLAPDAQTGQIVVHQVMPGSPAAASKLIQVGDVLRQCSAVFGEDMWQCRDIRRVKWALLNRSGQVKLILERGRAGAAPAWYSPGRMGLASSARDVLQLPLTLGPSSGARPAGAGGAAAATSSSEEEEGRPTARMLQVAFHRSFAGAQQRGQRGAGAAARAARVRQLRTQLAAVREEPPIDLGQPLHSSESRSSSPQATPPAPPPPPASTPQNGAVPFRRSSDRSTLLASTTRLLASFPPFTQHFARMAGAPPSPPTPPASPPPKQPVSAAVGTKRVVAVLPWLLAAMGSLSLPEMTHLASQRGLASVLQMGLQPQGGLFMVQGLPPPAAEPTPTPASTLVSATAMLHRLIKRRNSHVEPSGGHGDSSVVVQCAEGKEGQVAEVLAAWLHWYGGLGLQESARAAEQALGAPLAQPGLLEEATRLLTVGAVERASRVVLTWPYGGCEAQVSGEVVGGWGVQVPMSKCWHMGGCRGGAARGHFYLELKGLPAGAYSYKYIIDGTWALDLHAPKALDSSGNWNNVLQVVERAPLSGPDERLAAARMEAAWRAFEAKCGLRAASNCC